jgi:hypothetical protein
MCVNAETSITTFTVATFLNIIILNSTNNKDYIILAIIVGVLGYFHYIIDKQKREIDIIWTQIAILAASVAKKLTEYERKQINDGEKQ